MNWLLGVLAATLTLSVLALFVGAALFMALVDIHILTRIHERMLRQMTFEAVEMIKDKSITEARLSLESAIAVVDMENSRVNQLRRDSWAHAKINEIVEAVRSSKYV